MECLARICRELEAKLIHFSSNYIFSGEDSLYREDSPESPVNFYGMTKCMGEEAVLERSETGLRACVVRVSNLFGPGGTGISSKPSFFDAIDRASGTREFLNIIDDEVNCFTYTKDVAQRIAVMISEDYQGIYHLVNTEPVSWYEAARIYFELRGKQVTIRPVTGRTYDRIARRPKSAVLLSTRTAPLRSFREAMEEYVCRK